LLYYNFLRKRNPKFKGIIMATIDTAVSPEVGEMSDFDRERQDFLQCLYEYLDNQEPEPECPNHADELTYEGFCKAADELIGPFALAAERYYGRK
jgi:hypothetical protein